MTTSLRYHCSLPFAECLRLLREVRDQPEQWKVAAGLFAGDIKVKDDGRFMLTPGLNGIVGVVRPENSHSIVWARLSPPLWTVLILMYGPLIMMVQIFPPFWIMGWTLWATFLLGFELRWAWKAFRQLKAILPPVTPLGFPLVQQQEHGHRSTAAHATQTISGTKEKVC